MSMDEEIIVKLRSKGLDEKVIICMSDNRGVSSELLDAFNNTNGEFYEFKKHIDENGKKYAVCFRGNGEPEAITIYHNNHMVWELSYYSKTEEYGVKINFNHARYDKNWESKLNTIKDLFEIKEEIKPRKSGNGVSIKYITCKKKKGEKYTENFVTKTSEVILECMKSYFNPFENKDYFRTKVLRQEYFCKDKNACAEKQWQQELFHYFKNTENGIYVYDLEFAQKFPPAPNQTGNGVNEYKKALEKWVNEPDMLGVRFEDGKPKNIVLIEVKSSYTACGSKTSGIKAHLQKMKRYSDSGIFMNKRFDEVKSIFEQLKTLGYVDKSISDEDLKRIKNNKVEKILILTTDMIQVEIMNEDGEVDKKFFETKKGSAIKYYENSEKSKRQNVTKVMELCKDNECSLWIVRGRMDEEYWIEQVPVIS